MLVRGWARAAAGVAALVWGPVALAPAEAAATHPISIAQNRTFSPPDMAVDVGDTVTWTNASTEDHNVRGGPFASPGMKPNMTYSYTFTKAGAISYVCDFHPTMKGKLTVR